MNRKLIFLDIDGTLLPPGDMLIPDSTLQALRAARANGHKLFLCTGRNLHMTAPLLEYGCFDGAICSAGGYVLCDGQVLVCNDLLGYTDGFCPKFVKRYADLHSEMTAAFKAYAADVKARSFPAAEHTFKIDDEVLEKLY